MIRFLQWFILTYLTSPCWVLCCEVFKFWVRFDGLWNKEWQEPKLGDSHGTPRYSRTTKGLSSGMPRKASPLSSSFIGNFTWSYIFIHHMICVLHGASIYFVRICLLLFRIIFCIFYFNRSGTDSLYYAYVTSIHVAVWKQKVYLCCNNSQEKSECDKMLNIFA